MLLISQVKISVVQLGQVPTGWQGEREIQELLVKRVSKASIAKILRVSWPTIDHYIKTRGLVSPSGLLYLEIKSEKK